MSCFLLFFGLLQPLHISSFSTVVLAVINSREAVILHELFNIIVAYYFQINIIILYCEF